MTDINDLLQDRALVVDEMKTLNNLVESQSRDFTGPEQKKFDKLNCDQVNLKKRIDRMISTDDISNSIDGYTSGGDPVRPSVRGPKTAGEQWRDSQGNSAQVYAKSEKVFEPSGGSLQNSMNVGTLMSAMVLGASSPQVKNALSEGTDSAGGYTVPENLTRQMIDIMRSKSRVVEAGATTVMLGTDTTKMARMLTDPVPAWRAENASVAESDPTFDSVSFNARSLAVMVKVSRELLEDSINIDAALMNALSQSLALEFDRVALLGSGTAPEPRGVANTAGVLSVDMGTNGSVIASYAPVLSSMQQLSSANADAPTAAIMAPRSYYDFAGLLDTNNQPLNAPKAVAALPFLETTQIPVDEAHGTATDASRIIVGDYTQLMIGMRSSLRIEILREAFSDKLQYGFLAHMRADVAVAQPTSFCQMTGIIA